MVSLIRLLVVSAVGLTVVYVCLYYYFRSSETERLEASFDKEKPDTDRASFLRDGLAAAMPRLKKRLLLWVYAVPLSLIALVSYTPPE